MEGIRKTSAFTRMAAGALKAEQFKLVDVGCWGGIDNGWREFGPRLNAIGLDCIADEVERLTALEDNPAVQYVQGWVGLPEDHPILRRKAAPTPLHRWPGGRLSGQRSVHIREARARGESPLPLADYYRSVVHRGAPEPADGFDADYARVDRYSGHGGDGIIHLPRLLAERGFDDLDFLKIDIDGPDFDILRDLHDRLAQPGLLGVAIEVNFVGSHDANDHTFHNVDRLMRSHGFDLFNLTVRQYGSAALPWPYQDPALALTTGGRPVQGDAVYVRDLASPVHVETAARVSDEKLLKLAAMFAILNLPDEAAEVLLVHRSRLDALIDIERGLNLLALEIQETDGTDMSYAKYIEAFEAEAPQFLDQNGRRAIWLAGLIADQQGLKAAAARIQDLEQELAQAKASRLPEPQRPRIITTLRKLLSI